MLYVTITFLGILKSTDTIQRLREISFANHVIMKVYLPIMNEAESAVLSIVHFRF